MKSFAEIVADLKNLDSYQVDVADFKKMAGIAIETQEMQWAGMVVTADGICDVYICPPAEKTEKIA